MGILDRTQALEVGAVPGGTGRAETRPQQALLLRRAHRLPVRHPVRAARAHPAGQRRQVQGPRRDQPPARGAADPATRPDLRPQRPAAGREPARRSPQPSSPPTCRRAKRPRSRSSCRRLPASPPARSPRKSSSAASSNDPFSPIVFKDNLPQDVAFSIQEKLSSLPGVRVVSRRGASTRRARCWRTSSALSRSVDEDEYEVLKAQGYQLSDHIGKAGVELTYESVLRGTPGVRDVEADASGREIRVIDEQPAKAGANVILSIDLDLQKNVERMLREGMGPSKNAVRHHHGRQHRRDPLHGLSARLRQQRLLRHRRHGSRAPASTKTPASRCSTTPSPSSTRPVRPSR